MDLIKDVLLVLESAIGPILSLIKTLSTSGDENELRRRLKEYESDIPNIRQDLQNILDKYGK